MKKALWLALAVLMLSGCAAAKTAPAGLYERACGVAPDAVLLTVNGREIPAARYFYWLAADLAYLEEQCGGEPVWTADAGGMSLDAYVKAQALSATVFYAVVEEAAEKEGCTLTAEDLAAMDGAWDLAAAQGGEEDAYLAVLAQRGADETGAQLLAADCCLYAHLRETLSGEETAAAFAAEEKLATFDALCFSDGEAARAAREALESDSDGIAASGGVYTRLTAAPGDGALPPQAEETAFHLKAGAWSEPVETETGVWLLRAAPLDETEARSRWLDREMLRRAESAAVTLSDCYDGFTAASFFEGIHAKR